MLPSAGITQIRFRGRQRSAALSARLTRAPPAIKAGLFDKILYKQLQSVNNFEIGQCDKGVETSGILRALDAILQMNLPIWLPSAPRYAAETEALEARSNEKKISNIANVNDC